MSACVITVTDDSDWSTLIGVRVAVTITGSSELALLASAAPWSAAWAAIMQLNSEAASTVFFNVIPRPRTRARPKRSMG